MQQLSPTSPDVSPFPLCVTAPFSSATVETIKVLHVVNGEHYSGAERVQDLLAARMSDEGFDVGFACLRPDRFPQERQAKHAPLFEMSMGSKFDLSSAWRLARIVKQNGYRLLHAHTPRSLLIGRLASKLTGVPLVYHVHSPAARDSTSGWRNWCNALSERWSLGGAAALITVSGSLGREMRSGPFSEDKIHVVPNGVPVPACRRRGAAPRGNWTIGTVALFRPRKGTELLLDAVAQLRQSGQELRVRAVGPFETPDYESQLRRHAEPGSL